MKNSLKRALAIVLCLTLAAGVMVGAGAADQKDAKDELTEELTQSLQDRLSGLTQSETDSDTPVKDETVYVLAGCDGSVQRIIVSDWIKNPCHEQTLCDVSELTDVENVKGDETYVMNSGNACVWVAQGNDIYYQGNIEKTLPVSLRVSYQLDGESISAEELAGRSGRVTIRFDYQNNEYTMADIDGRQEKIYIPFAMLTGVLLDNDVFSNVTVSNGKIINDGDRTFVAGLALPGMQENLDLDREKLELPDYVEISADAEEFALMNTVTIAGSNLFERLAADDSEAESDLDRLNDSLDELTNAMAQLLDGSSKLYDGLCTLLEKSGELVDGVNKLADGAAELRDGAGDLDEGAGKLLSGTQELGDGLQELCDNSQKLNDGARQVFDSLLKVANTQIQAAGLTIPELTIDNYDEVLGQALASLDPDSIEQQVQAGTKQTVTDAVNASRSDVQAAVTAAVQAEVTQQVTQTVQEGVEEQVLQTALGMSREDYDAAVSAELVTAEQQAMIESAVQAQMQSEDVQALIAAKVAEQMASPEIAQLIEQKTDETVQQIIDGKLDSDEVKQQSAAALAQAQTKAAAGRQSLTSLREQLASYDEFYTGLRTYTDGVGKARDGAEELTDGTRDLKDGTEQLLDGVEELYDGILQLKDGTPALLDGVTELRDGSMELSDGLKEFDEQGVQRIVDAFDGDLSGLVARVRACSDAAKEYRTFSGLSDTMDVQVKFIYRTESIERR